MRGAASKVNATAAQLDEEEHIQRLQEERLNGEKIASQNLVFIMAHQMAPARGATAFGRWWNTVPSEDVANRFVADCITQFSQFALNLAIASIRVLARQPYNESFDICRCTWTTTDLRARKRPLASD